VSTGWGELSTPPHVLDAPSEAPWRDNAFLSFHDVGAGVAGAVHVSTSPNAPGRARASVVVDGTLREVVEHLGARTFRGAAIHFDVEGRVVVQTSELALELFDEPRFVVADYTALQLLPPLPGHEPLVHYQQGANVHGSVRVGDRLVEVAGTGFRDRTWGWRDESLMFVEYLAFAACFHDFDITLVKLLDDDGATRTGGFRLAADAEPVLDAVITRSASGLLARLDVTLADGEQLTCTPERSVGFWAPMGVERRGPTLSAYEEGFSLDAGRHGRGEGGAEHGILRRLW
jgi:hypothetical protein